jgi:hypothetical protein
MSAVFESQIPDQEYTDKKGKKTTVKSSTLKFILLALADHASDTGESVYPSIEYLKRKTSMGGVGTCVAAIGALENLGILKHIGNRIKGNKEYRISLSGILGFRPAESTIPPSGIESSLTINEPSINAIPEKALGIAAVVKTFDPDEIEKPKKIKQPKKTNHIKMLEPQTKGERILFGLLQAEITATRGQGWKVATRFPSKACKDMFDETEEKLNGELQTAIKSGLQKGILSIPNLVAWVHGWMPKEKEHATNADLRAKGYPV